MESRDSHAMTRLYLAGPLFSEAERQYNIRLREMMGEHGYELFLPQDMDLRIDPERMSDGAYRDAATMMAFE